MTKDTFFLPYFAEAILIEKVTSDTRAIIGRDVESGALIRVGDKERCGGLYVLGQPRTGKSNLLVSMALRDIDNGHGILFIDPHTDAIDDLLARIPDRRRRDIILLDPTLKERSFGINLLHCDDPTNGMVLDKTWGRIRDIFIKVWEQEKGQLGFWLDKILRNSVYLLLENPGYTMVELPLLLREDTTFRNTLLENVKIKHFVKDFWYYEFDRLSKRDRTEQVGPALNRLSVFRDIDIVRDIVGQEESTIDFKQIMRDEKIVLLRLPINLASDVKNLIGTMLLSEVLYAAFERAKLPEKDRPFFGIYCDEFQEFATPDFAKLFTQTGKYGIMPVVAHQTRVGQFKQGDPNQGATLAAPNKVLFTLSPADAKELALEFAEKPPTETRPEEQYVISQNPVYDLLKGHSNPEIRAFVNKYLRHLQDHREDVKGDMDRARIQRMIHLDQAGIYSLDERLENLRSHDYGRQAGHLRMRGEELLRAQDEGVRLLNLFDISDGLRLTVRGLNTFLTSIMEGTITKGQEAFSDFLINLVRGLGGIDADYAQHLECYIALSYGDAKTARAIPPDVADDARVFTRDVNVMRPQFEAKLRWENLPKDMVQSNAAWPLESHSLPESYLGKEGASIEPHYGDQSRLLQKGEQGIRVSIPYHSFQWSEYALLVDYALMRLCPQIAGMLEPYYTARFSREEEEDYMKVEIPDIEEVIRKIQSADSNWLRTGALSGEHIIESLSAFLRRYREGAFVAFVLLALARLVYQKIKLGQNDPWWILYYDPDIIGVDWRDIKQLTYKIDHAVLAFRPILSPRVPSGSEIQKLKQPCREKLIRVNEQIRKVTETIDEFVAFCDLLSKPENQIKIRTGQFVERQVNTRQEADMVNEAARLLTSLPRYTAYARVVEESRGEQKVWKGKIRTDKLSPAPEGFDAAVAVLTHSLEKKARLVYRSDFAKPTGWVEENSEGCRFTSRDGYYYITISSSLSCGISCPPIILDDFRAQVDVKLYIKSGDSGAGGIMLDLGNENDEDELCMFALDQRGYYSLSTANKSFLDWQESEFIKKGESTNTLMVERIGQKVILGINDHIVATIAHSAFSRGYVGIFFETAAVNSYAEARFRNFELYAIEGE